MVESRAVGAPTAADIIQLVDRDLDLFEAINDGDQRHLVGGKSLPPMEPLTHQGMGRSLRSIFRSGP